MSTEQKLLLAAIRYLDAQQPRSAKAKIAAGRLKEAIEQARGEFGMKTVRNLMSGNEIQIAIDTPIGCDPSSETYWSM